MPKLLPHVKVGIAMMLPGTLFLAINAPALLIGMVMLIAGFFGAILIFCGPTLADEIKPAIFEQEENE